MNIEMINKMRARAGLDPVKELSLSEDFDLADKTLLDEALTLSEEELQEGLWQSLKGVAAGVNAATEGAIIAYSSGKWKIRWKSLVKQLEAAQKEFTEISNGILESDWFNELEMTDKKNAQSMRKTLESRDKAFTMMIKDMISDNAAINRVGKGGQIADAPPSSRSSKSTSTKTSASSNNTKHRAGATKSFVAFGDSARKKLSSASGFKSLGEVTEWKLSTAADLAAKDFTVLNDGDLLILTGNFKFDGEDEYEITGIIINPEDSQYTFITSDNEMISAKPEKVAPDFKSTLKATEKVWK